MKKGSIPFGTFVLQETKAAWEGNHCTPEVITTGLWVERTHTTEDSSSGLEVQTAQSLCRSG